MVLVLVTHSVSAVTAKVPFVMITLLDHVRVQKDLPQELRCRQVFPTSGLCSSSLWDVTSVDVLRLWLDENLPADSQNNIYEVQEDFVYGISAELARMRAAEKVSATTRAATAAVQDQIHGVDAHYKVSEQASQALKAARDATQQTAAKAAAALSRARKKAMENENVAAAASSMAAGWKSAGKGLASGYNYIARAGSGGSPRGPSPAGSGSGLSGISPVGPSGLGPRPAAPQGVPQGHDSMKAGMSPVPQTMEDVAASTARPVPVHTAGPQRDATDPLPAAGAPTHTTHPTFSLSEDHDA